MLDWLVLHFKFGRLEPCGNSLALRHFAAVMELPNSLRMNCKSEFDFIFLKCYGSVINSILSQI